MTNGTITKAFLNSVDVKVKNEILQNIATHYQITIAEAYEEITDEESENIMDYVTGVVRLATSALYNKFCYKYSF